MQESRNSRDRRAQLVRHRRCYGRQHQCCNHYGHRCQRRKCAWLLRWPIIVEVCFTRLFMLCVMCRLFVLHGRDSGDDLDQLAEAIHAHEAGPVCALPACTGVGEVRAIDRA